MKETMIHTGILTGITREKSSFYGNPRFSATLLIGQKIKGCQYEVTFKTAPNSGLGYSIQNFDGKEVTIELKWYYNQLTLSSIEKVSIKTTPLESRSFMTNCPFEDILKGNL